MDNLSDVKIVFIDIDGTLVNSKKEISMKTIASIERLVEKGKYVVLCSGRDTFHTVNRSISSHASPIVICSTGAFIYDYVKDDVLYCDNISSSIIRKVCDYTFKMNIGLILVTSDRKYYNSLFDTSITDGTLISEDLSNLPIDDTLFTQIILLSNDYEKLSSSVSFCESLGLLNSSSSLSFLNSTSDSLYSVDFNNVGVSKGNAIKRLLKELDIDPNFSLCFGDHINDISMFEACKFSVAMGNSVDELKNIATFVTDTNDNDGVALFIDKYF